MGMNLGKKWILFITQLCFAIWVQPYEEDFIKAQALALSL